MAAQEGAPGGSQQVVMRWRYGDVGDSNFAVHGRAVPLLVGLLCAVVFFVALCLYIRWRCHRYTPDPEADASSSPAAAAAAASLPGLDADAIRRLPVTLYRPPASPPARLPGKGDSGGDDGETDEHAAALCSICISALVAGEKVKVLPPCGHCFHPDCVDAWLRSQASCPLCRCLLAAKPAAVNGSDDAV
ncbi:RING-H2 finger protein ATL66-like [Panicum miliaceum]|uniref:RING-type E3 ubiquitin transferase n=1 Tax=Panicum miliaceum TaxID=4540 RepID=A0A3L6T4M2_PANMI|nr:RING-H2 finger protein ATL66-like [Panicum miliaceum]